MGLVTILLPGTAEPRVSATIWQTVTAVIEPLNESMATTIFTINS